MRLGIKASVLFAFAAVAACGQGPNASETLAQSQQAIGPYGINGYSTTSGWVGDSVTIYGKGFTTDGYTQVQFLPTTEAFPFTNTVCSSTTTCSFNVPPMRSVGLGGNVRFQVLVNGTPLPDNTPMPGYFTLNPVDLTLSDRDGGAPRAAPSTGGDVTITGHGFFDGRYGGNYVGPGPYFSSPMGVSFSPVKGGPWFEAGLSCNGTECTVLMPPMPSWVTLGEPLLIHINAFAEGWATAQGFAYTTPPACQPHGCRGACGGQIPDGCGGSITCNGCPSGEACVAVSGGSHCQVDSCPKHPHCPKGTAWSDAPVCACEGLN